MARTPIRSGEKRPGRLVTSGGNSGTDSTRIVGNADIRPDMHVSARERQPDGGRSRGDEPTQTLDAGPHTARAKKAWRTRRSPWYRAGRSERASKAALVQWCTEHGWKAVFFEGRTGAPRTGVVDAVLVRIAPREADSIEVRLVQLKAGAGGLTAGEVKRLKGAVVRLKTEWLLAAFDGEVLHFVPDLPAPSAAAARSTSKPSRHGVSPAAPDGRIDRGRPRVSRNVMPTGERSQGKLR